MLVFCMFLSDVLSTIPYVITDLDSTINEIVYIFKIFFKDFIYLFLERGEGKEKEGEKHQCVVAS